MHLRLQSDQSSASCAASPVGPRCEPRYPSAVRLQRTPTRNTPHYETDSPMTNEDALYHRTLELRTPLEKKILRDHAPRSTAWSDPSEAVPQPP